MNFKQWQQKMIAYAQRIQDDRYPGDEYYLQDCWRDYFDDGCTPEDAVDSDMECWEPDSAA